MTPPAPGAVTLKKAVARVALIDIDDDTSAVLTDCFRQFAIQAVRIPAEHAVERLQKEKLEAMVVRLKGDAGQVITTARSSPSNCRMVIYAIATEPGLALKYARLGINAVLDDPVERQAALRVVRATHLLVVHELRRYVRIPIITGVSIFSDNGRISGQSREISGGGMSIKVEARFSVGQSVEVRFDLPHKPSIRIAALVCWLHEPAGLIGVRFNADDERRAMVREWIDDYLEIS